MSSLRQALQKIGFASTEQNKIVERRPKKAPPKNAGVDAVAQSMRNQCENCLKFTPDVERYMHKNRLVKGYWLCLRCADASSINDDFRVSAQSTQARSGRFLREYGHTKTIRK